MRTKTIRREGAFGAQDVVHALQAHAGPDDHRSLIAVHDIFNFAEDSIPANEYAGKSLDFLQLARHDVLPWLPERMPNLSDCLVRAKQKISARQSVPHPDVELSV